MPLSESGCEGEEGKRTNLIPEEGSCTSRRGWILTQGLILLFSIVKNGSNNKVWTLKKSIWHIQKKLCIVEMFAFHKVFQFN